ncbi:hypothetical protein ACFSUK_07030 [Sphingobium scionense]
MSWPNRIQFSTFFSIQVSSTSVVEGGGLAGAAPARARGPRCWS